MRHRLSGTVESITSERAGAQEISVRPNEGSALRSALNLVDLTGRVEVGDTVFLNTVAVEMGLGTGGLDFVVSVTPSRLPDSEPAGHILKLRYTPFQHPVLATEAPESPHHTTLNRFQTLDALPVVCTELHSQLGAVCSGIRWAAQAHNHAHTPRVAYIMTDSSALPLALSRLVPVLKEERLLHATITAGHAFGGDYEAVNLYSALAIAKEVVHADIVIVGQGPGNVGTGTSLGFSGLEQGLAVNAAASLGGVPIFTPRISFADSRRRHKGLSHHTFTTLRSVVRASAWIPIPRLAVEQLTQIYTVLEELEMGEELQPIVVDADQSLEEMERIRPYVNTMGRNLEEDRAFFLTASASGILAVQLLEVRHA